MNSVMCVVLCCVVQMNASRNSIFIAHVTLRQDENVRNDEGKSYVCYVDYFSPLRLYIISCGGGLNTGRSQVYFLMTYNIICIV